MKQPMRYIHCVTLIAGILAAIAVLSSCSYFAGDLEQIAPAPAPGSATIKPLPTITGCHVGFQTTSKQDHYIAYADWCCYNPCGCHPPRPEDPPAYGYPCPDCPCCFWCLRRLLDSTDVTGNMIVTLQVDDPSNDLAGEHSPRVFLTNAADSGGGTPTSCTVDVPSTSFPLGAGDIAGTGTAKTVTFAVRGLTMTFNSGCRTFSSKYSIKILFEDCGTTLTTDPCEAPALVIPRP